MSVRHRHPPALLSALLLLVLGGAPGARSEETDGLAPWRSTESLVRHLGEAVEAVEAVCGAWFEARPAVVVSTQAEVEAIVAARGDAAGRIESSIHEARTFIAYYDPPTTTIHVVPDGVAELARLLDVPDLVAEDVLRVVMVHEATHALDFQRFPLQEALACCHAADERLALESVLEGHAQLVAEEVSRSWGIEGAFQRLTHVYAGACQVGTDREDISFDQQAAFTYLQGHAFLRSVQVASGRAAVDRILASPPRETRVIDRPLLWLTPRHRGEEHDLKAVLEAFRPLVRARDWTVSKWRVLGPGGCVALDAPGGGGGGAMIEAYVDNHSLFAGAPDGNRYLNAFVARCASDEAAERFVGALAGIDGQRDEEAGWEPPVRADGAGPAGAWPGFTTTRKAVGGLDPPTLYLAVLQSGTFVIELTVYGAPGVTRPAAEEALDLAARLLAGPPPEAVSFALAAQVQDFLRARHLGWEDAAATLLRDLLPADADLARGVVPSAAGLFLDGYRGIRLAERASPAPRAMVSGAFDSAGPSAHLEAWAATTEELAAGLGHAERFPAAMRTFAGRWAAPGATWAVLEVRDRPLGQPKTHCCFLRVGDRFAYLTRPWTAMPE